MSPKSMIPVTVPASSTRRLSSVTSLWITCARMVGSRGTTRSVKRAITPIEKGAPRTIGDERRVRRTGRGGAAGPTRSIRPAAGWKNPRSACAAGHDVADPARSRASSSSGRGVPAGEQRDAAGRDARPRRSRPVRLVRRRAPAVRGAPAGPGRPPRPLDGGHLHLDHAGILGGVRDLENPFAPVGRAHAEVLVPLADKRHRLRHGETPGGPRDVGGPIGAQRGGGTARTSAIGIGADRSVRATAVPARPHATRRRAAGALESATVTPWPGLLPPSNRACRGAEPRLHTGGTQRT